MMSKYEDELFDQRIHDAYERVELSEDAQDRMLANLLAARDKADEAAAQPASPERKATVRRMSWQRWLPVAAVVFVGLVVVGLSVTAPKNAYQASEAVMEAESYAAEDAAGADAVADMADKDSGALAPQAVQLEENAAVASGSADEQADSEQADTLADTASRFCVVTMPDGRQLTTLPGDATEPAGVLGDAVGKLVGQATATTPDGGQTVACEVFELVDGSSAFAVRYQGEQDYWRCELV